ncbi:aromatic acid exporter family protein [Planococcus sp. N028]|uniref:Aromatic acid exporter family protein n=1 Tax=Planococcus shixiaomingii TaxID=3058393 RepID=A0ABT8MY08_9BACL|nr:MULTISPECIES: aromatic acid exporter family protein [unclassified Planococcus (in: firmicutes)]MDN7240522.1 aromatic acid exporter family protein [Planococcus sp. N028]WKA56417.1 aromatic acid exporter family protein [Planococcus sp. N022]
MKLKRFSIGYRTMKTAAGVAIAISLAQLLQLDYYVSAGILTILCIKPTKKKSIQAAFSRFIASLIGIAFAFVFFEGIAYHPLVLGLMILLFIPVLVSFGFSEGFVSSAVILLHIYDSKNLTGGLFVNELMLMAIGFGTALVVNGYMPSIERKLDSYRYEIEKIYSTIFHEIVVYLRQGDSSWSGKELVEAAEILKKAKALAYQDVENHVTRLENKHYRYFDMREQQFDIIERILPKITALPVMVGHSDLVADFLEDLGEHVHSGNTAQHYMNKLAAVKEDFAGMPLPQNHEMFLAMASLYQVIQEMETYLEIKQSYRGFHNKKAAEV